MDNERQSLSERFSGLVDSAGAALTVILALMLLAGIATIALLRSSGGDQAAIATAAFTAIGTISGAYVGVRVGAHGRDRAEKAKNESQRVVERVAEKTGEGQVSEAREEVQRELQEDETKRSHATRRP